MKMINKIPSSKYVLHFFNLLIQHLFTNYAFDYGAYLFKPYTLCV